MAQGLESWDSPEHGVQVDAGGVTNLVVVRVPPHLVDAEDGPNGAWVEGAEQTDGAGFVTSGVIWIPDNVVAAVCLVSGPARAG